LCVNFSLPDNSTHADTISLLEGKQCSVDNDDNDDDDENDDDNDDNENNVLVW
jgi:hypothetical protein